ncbi:hypothetical protein [Pasteurella langaaensis]|uniref:hypothetical protein n=1 Tax=Alitibacter langaaensis TaxID=756 RepID=UPI001403E4B8|nr:hypothetical protein [Pasteurella langaaensis]
MCKSIVAEAAKVRSIFKKFFGDVFFIMQCHYALPAEEKGKPALTLDIYSLITPS